MCLTPCELREATELSVGLGRPNKKEPKALQHLLQGTCPCPAQNTGSATGAKPSEALAAAVLRARALCQSPHFGDSDLSR